MKAIKTNAAYVNREFPEMATRLAKKAQDLLANGPTRVLGRDGFTGLTTDAANEAGIYADYALVRHDGWSLGYEAAAEDKAEDMWAGEWVARVDLLTGEVDYLNAT